MKYQRLVCSFANTTLGRDYLGIPQNAGHIFKISGNSYHELVDPYTARAVFYTFPHFEERLSLGLTALDIASEFKQDTGALFHYLGLRENRSVYPSIYFTTTVFNPDATHKDGELARNGVNEAFSTIRSGAGTSWNGGAQLESLYMAATSTANQWGDYRRFLLLFDTSSIGSGQVVSAGTLSYYLNGKVDNFSQSVCIVAPNPSSVSAPVASDYNIANWGSTELATRKTLASQSTGAYVDYTLNASGTSNVSLTGTSKFGLRWSSDIDNSAPSWSSLLTAQVEIQTSRNVSGNKPKLSVTYSSASRLLSLLGVGT